MGLSAKISNAIIAKAKRENIDEIHDTEIKGFQVRIGARGATYRYRYLSVSTQKRGAVTIGKFPGLNADDARKEVQKLIGKIAAGIDPAAERVEKIKKAKQEKQQTLGAYLKGRYAQYQARKKSGTQTIQMIERHFNDWLDRPMKEISRADIKNWQIDREATGLQFDTIKRVYGAFKTMLNNAVEDGFIDTNPLPKKSPLERPHSQESKKSTDDRRILTEQEINNLFSGLNQFNEEIKAQRLNSIRHGKPNLFDLSALKYAHWAIPFTMLAYYTGLRTGDIYGLTWSEVNLNLKRLTKIPEKTRHHPSPIEVNLDLNAEIIEMLKYWKADLKKQGIESDWVFPSPVTGARMDKKAHVKPWVKIKNLAGLPSALDFYALRHNWISTLVMAGLPLFTVARMAGHKTTLMIEKHYGHLSPSATKDVLDIFSRNNQK
ncbi:integrase [Thiomicrospira aerophila AL3]|uniref:Integrase n=1 Tax=Thiomicrospira aerophila AL3 TaxID=717772 RepID=W0DWJ8_9GAMM|nr:tyrosine-type recombinase/integrase [Thiomicrospira aerophila]AHF01369.1 integrase [Thiomicrospira aerophila AL3]